MKLSLIKELIKEYKFDISILALFIAVIVGKYYYIYYSIIVLGEKPAIELTGVILLFLSFLLLRLSLILLGYLTFVLDLIFPKFQPKDSNSCIIDIFIVCFGFLCLFGPAFLYFLTYYKTVDNIKSELMEKSHIETGMIYKITTPTYGGSSLYNVWAGTDKNHITKHRIHYDTKKKCRMGKGDLVTLRVSDDYPRVNEIIKCNGTKLGEGHTYPYVIEIIE